MPSVPLAIKSVTVGGIPNKGLVIPPRSALHMPIKYDDPTVNFGAWQEIRVGILYDFESGDGGVPVADQDVNDGNSSSFYFGIKNKSDNFPLGDIDSLGPTGNDGGGFFLGICQDPTMNVGFSGRLGSFNVGASYNYQRGFRPAVAAACRMTLRFNLQGSAFTRLSPGASSLPETNSPVTTDDIVGSAPISTVSQVFRMAFRILINPTTRVVRLGTYANNGGNCGLADFGITSDPSMAGLLSFLDGGFTSSVNVTFTFGSDGTGYLMEALQNPNNSELFINNPYLNNAMRIHAVAIKKYS